MVTYSIFERKANMPKGIYKRKPRSTKYAAGTVHETPAGRIRILEHIYHPDKANRAVILFEESGWVANVQCTNIPAGKIRDCRKRTVYGVGYLGTDIRIPSRESGSIIRRLYDLWANMLKRCYGPYKGQYEGVVVDVRWHSFSAFMNTVTELPGYAEWEAHRNYVLDKDIRVPGNKVYSKDTCMFVDASENIAEASNRRWGNQ